VSVVEEVRVDNNFSVRHEDRCENQLVGNNSHSAKNRCVHLDESRHQINAFALREAIRALERVWRGYKILGESRGY
jgi:hypothetical protein